MNLGNADGGGDQAALQEPERCDKLCRNSCKTQATKPKRARIAVSSQPPSQFCLVEFAFALVGEKCAVKDFDCWKHVAYIVSFFA
jgi:hypothetical protein